ARKIEMSKSYLFHSIRELATLAGVAAKDGRRVAVEDLNVISDAAMIVAGGKVQWAGAKSDMPKTGSLRPSKVNLQGATVVPGFVDCHTHLVFAGDRHAEFEMRNKGATYQDIAAKGGGIQSTVRATQSATVAELKKSGRERLQRLLRQGVTTVEIKSGYG